MPKGNTASWSSRLGSFAKQLLSRLTKACQTSCPWLLAVWRDPPGTHRVARAVFGFFLGILLGILFYELVIVDLAFDRYTSLGLGAMVIVMLAIGCASSIQIRCICILTIPGLCGRAGRSVLKAVVLAYVIAGPIFNLAYNCKEVVRTFSCTTELTYNLTKTRFDLMYKPFQQAILGIKADASEIKHTLSSVRELSMPIVAEIEGEEEMHRMVEENEYTDEQLGDTKRAEEIATKRDKRNETANEGVNKTKAEVYETRYREKMRGRCEDQLEKGSKRCGKMFEKAYDDCYETVTWVVGWLLCWPMKITFVCNIAQAMGGSSVCNPEGKIDVGIGEGYAALKGSTDKLGSSLKDAQLRYKLKINPVHLSDVRRAGEQARAVMHEFESRRRIFEGAMMILRRCLAFVFIRVVLVARSYHDKYLTDIEFDNIYMTGYFRRIDARRRLRGSRNLLPLRKLERQKLVQPCTAKPSKSERSSLLGQTVKLALEMITATTFVLLDRLFYDTLEVVQRHSRIDYAQRGHHDTRLEVRGSGVIATLIREIVRGFNGKRRVKTVATNAECLPRPRELPRYVLEKIYGTYLIAWVMLFVSAYAGRSHRLVCGFFYRRREKRRVLYLYNETLRQRLGLLRFMRVRARALVRAQSLEGDTEIRWFLALRTRAPRLCGWLGCFACAREKCLICGEVEPWKGPKYRRCDTPGCRYVHCPECWRDVGRICYACADLRPDEDDDYDEDHDEYVTRGRA